MKKFLVLFAMVAFVGSMASAQATKTCTKSKAACTKSKTACTASKASTASLVSTKGELPACSVKAAAHLASLDETVQAKTCATSGKVSYYQKSTCATSGKVSMKEVKYCGTSKAFVNVAPPTTKPAVLQTSTTKGPAAKKACKKSCAKTCSKSKATATKAEAGTAKQVNNK